MLELFLLGAIQGLTEFLPVSSSGHLVLAKHFLGVQSTGAELEILLHAATSFAVLIYFAKDFKALLTVKQNHSEFNLLHILLACLITGSVGLMLKDQIIDLFDKPLMVALALIVMGICLLVSKYIPVSTKNMTLWTTVWFGSIQIIALIPGISRSGITIIALLLVGIQKKTAFRFSFISSLPLILAATAFQCLEGISPQILVSLLPGFVSAFIFGYLALAFLEKCLISNRFHTFGYYCLAIGIIAASKLMVS